MVRWMAARHACRRHRFILSSSIDGLAICLPARRGRAVRASNRDECVQVPAEEMGKGRSSGRPQDATANQARSEAPASSQAGTILQIDGQSCRAARHCAGPDDDLAVVHGLLYFYRLVRGTQPDICYAPLSIDLPARIRIRGGDVNRAGSNKSSPHEWQPKIVPDAQPDALSSHPSCVTLIKEAYMRKAGSIAASLILLVSAAVAAFSADSATGPKTPLLSDKEIKALADEISGVIAKDTITELARSHRVQASSGFARAAGYIASRAREYGLQNVQIEHFPADGQKTYYTLKSTPGWEVERAELWETSPNKAKVADYDEMRVALADYSQSADVVGQLIDVGAGASPFDYEGKEVRGKLVLAGGSVAAVHKLACDERGAAGVLSSMQNQVTAWSGDYVDNVRWGHLSPYNSSNKFAFMISDRKAREFRERLAAGQKITLHALVKAEMKPSNYDVVTAVIPGSDLAGEEIVFSCHLCHQKPGANDNASGAAAILEIARTLMTLINRGDIEKPRRTIRFIWPPEIAGTVAYLAFHPDIVSRMKAVIHLDMVGGDHAITKAVLHTTHTPASLPSCVNAVADVFTEYVIEGSQRAAAGGGFEDALISPEGSKESFFADMGPYTMGSDHDVYEEGTFRIPAIYLADWPDVFIHTNNDLPSNIDATKIKRSSFIDAASGYFLARARFADAARLGDRGLAMSMSRLPRINARAANLESRGREGASDEARSLISNSAETEAAALSS